jgi:predicted PurR-regulated permease PerM
MWGPSGWKFLHSITLSYPSEPSEKDKQSIINFFQTLPAVLPCEACAEHLTQHYSKYPIKNAINSRDELVKWLFDIHNEVNASLGKSIKKFDDFINEYKNESKKFKGKPLNMVCSNSFLSRRNIFLLLLIIFVIVLLYHKRSIMNYFNNSIYTKK